MRIHLEIIISNRVAVTTTKLKVKYDDDGYLESKRYDFEDTFSQKEKRKCIIDQRQRVFEFYGSAMILDTKVGEEN